MKNSINYLMLLLGLLIIPMIHSCEDADDMDDDNVTEVEDQEERNKELARTIQEAWDQNNYVVFDTILADDAVDHSSMEPDIPAKEQVKLGMERFHSAFTNVNTEIHDIVAEGDMVMYHYTTTATNSGPLMGRPATNKEITMKGVDIVRFEDGKAVEHWGYYNDMEMMQQMGMMPDMSGMESMMMDSTQHMQQ